MGEAVAFEVNTPEVIISIVYCLGMIAAFFVGVKNLCVKKVPLYFRLIVYAVGCSALESICALVAILCNNTNDPTRIGRMVSAIACYLFFASANWGQIDGLVDDKSKKNFKVRFAALLFPVIAAAVALFVWNGIAKENQTVLAVFTVVEMFPLAMAGYFALKHLLLPMDPLEIKRVTRPINITILIAMGLGLLNMISLVFLMKNLPILNDLVRPAWLIDTVCMIIFAIKGNKIWKTLV